MWFTVDIIVYMNENIYIFLRWFLDLPFVIEELDNDKLLFSVDDRVFRNNALKKLIDLYEALADTLKEIGFDNASIGEKQNDEPGL